MEEKLNAAALQDILAGQWVKPEERLPAFGEKVLLLYKTRHNGRWLTIYSVETRRDWFDPFTEKDRTAIAWMPIPPLPNELERYL